MASTYFYFDPSIKEWIPAFEDDSTDSDPWDPSVLTNYLNSDLMDDLGKTWGNIFIVKVKRVINHTKYAETCMIEIWKNTVSVVDA